MGAMNTGDYANDSFMGQAHRPADPAQKVRIKQLVTQAENLERLNWRASQIMSICSMPVASPADNLRSIPH